jgi:4-azaleucine resistance transporter AzlC
MPSPRSELLKGIKTVSPILLGVIPFATISGIAAVEAGLSVPMAAGMSIIMFAGAAQLASVQLIAAGAAPFVIVLTALVINLRFLMYSASLAPHLATRPFRWKAILAYLTTDQAYAISLAHFEQAPENPDKHWFFVGTAATLWVVWQAGTVAGILAGAFVPEHWSLDFAIPLTFIAVVVPAIKDGPAFAAAVMAGLVAVLAAGLPLNLGLIVGASAGIMIGTILDLRPGWREP